MTDRERLIELIVNADTHDSYECKLCTKKDVSCTRCNAGKLADDLLANDVIASPLKLGDKIYKIFDIESIHRKIVKIEVLEIEIIFRRSCGTVRKKYLYNYNAFTNDDFGKTVFLTKEEAERELEKRRNNA